jgi:hypothetical protein
MVEYRGGVLCSFVLVDASYELELRVHRRRRMAERSRTPVLGAVWYRLFSFGGRSIADQKEGEDV